MQVKNENFVRAIGCVCFTKTGKPSVTGSGDISRVIVGREYVPYTAAVINIIIDNEYLQRMPLISPFV